MRKLIPQPVIGVLSSVIPNWTTHDSLDALFLYAGAPGEPPPVSKSAKVQKWLFETNKDLQVDPLIVLGKILEKFLDDVPDPKWDEVSIVKTKTERNDRLRDVLAGSGLSYTRGGNVSSLDSPQVKSLEEEIKKLNEPAIDYEFKRAVENVDRDPFEAVSAACNILESVFKVIIEKRDLEMPKIQDLGGLWKVLKKELGLDPHAIGDQDVQQILSGLSSIISGIAALRTHASSAHGRGSFRYPLKSRHALLAIHSAHSLALFVIQTWHEKYPSA